VGGALHWSGAGSLYRTLHPHPGTLILMYHSVPDRDIAQWIDPRYAVPVDLFARQMKFLARRRRVIGMTELLDLLQRGESAGAGTVVITFDDGYRDTLTTAANVLSEVGLPATLYLATGYVTRGETQWTDRLYSMFELRSRDRLVLEQGEKRLFDLRDPSARRVAYGTLESRLLVARWSDRQELLAEVGSQLRPSQLPPRLTLNWEEVNELRRRHTHFEIGVHTRDHLDLVVHGAEAAARELHDCVEDVRRELQQSVAHLSYPYGRADAKTRGVAAGLGFRSAAVTEPAALVRQGSDRFSLPRVEAPRSLSLFRFWTSGAYPDLPRSLLGRA